MLKDKLFNNKFISKITSSFPPPSFYNRCFIISLNFIEGFGESIAAVFLLLLKLAVSGLLSAIRFIWSRSEVLRETVINFSRIALVVAIAPFTRLLSRFSRHGRNLKKIRERNEGRLPVKDFFFELHNLIFGRNGLAISFFNILFPAAALWFFIGLITYENNFDYGVRLEIDGELYGYIENEEIFTEAQKYVDSRLNYLGSSKLINVSPSFTIEKTGYGEFLTPIQVADMILSYSNISVEPAYGIYLNGSLIGAVTDNSGIEASLNDILKTYVSGDPDEEVKFLQDISYEQGGIYTSESIIDPALVLSQITSLKQRAQYYTVVEGDSHSLICDKINMTMAQVEALNPGFSQKSLHAGDKIQYSVDVPFLDVSVTKTEIYDKAIPYKTTYRNDSGMYVGTSRPVQEGKNGKNRITARVSKVNGEERGRKILKTVKISDPVNEIIARGTKPAPSNYSPGSASYGKFIWPINPSGPAYVSELTHEDGGYSGHRGIDFAGPYGTPVYAGDGGIVVWSGVYYDYGRTVMIDHPNGLRTLYAHNSQLFVSVGEQVSQGQQIAAIGQTGRAYGNHVHFEVIQGNIKYNPRLFLDGISVR